MRVLILAFMLGQLCFAQAVKVRVINGKTGHPMPKQQITVQFLYEKPSRVISLSNFETDSNGEVEFNFPNPVPEHLHVGVILTSGHWHCGCLLMADTQTVLQNGAVIHAHNNAHSTKLIKASRGEIIFIPRPFSLFDRMLSPLARQ